jgi:hypothetical protein
MDPLRIDDLLPLSEFVPRRGEFLEAHRRYCEQYRRIHLGPHAVLQFENRQTLWFRAQEMIRIMGLEEPEWVKGELSLINRLLPGAHRLQAGLVLGGPADEAAPWGELELGSIRLALDSIMVPGRLTSCRPEDRALGLAHWLEFAVSTADRKLLADDRLSAWFEIQCGDYRHTSGPLTEEVRQSLLDDLTMSGRAAA